MNSVAEKEFCTLEHHPCRSAYRHDVYDNARKCRNISVKRCKADPTKKKTCESAKRGISRLRKKELCSYIVGNPAFRHEGHVGKKNFNHTLKKSLGETLERKFFTPKKINMAERKKSTIGDVQRALYLAKYSGGTTIVYSEADDSKVYWTIYDEEEEKYLEDWRLTFPENFEQFVRTARRRGIERIFINMRLYKQLQEVPDATSKHANFLLLDMKNSLLYRYEPSGYGQLYEVFNMDELDTQLAAWGRKRGLKYIPPWDSCPTQLFAKVAAQQRVAGKAEKHQADPGGFCKVWSTFMMEQKLRHPEMDMNDLQKYLIRLFIENNIDMTHFARTYIERVNQYGNQILKEHGMKEGEDAHEYFDEHFKALLNAAVRK
jgi:hypothetical protein